MATCNECFRMGYPLRNGVCKACRTGSTRALVYETREMERAWRQTGSRVPCEDPSPLLGDNYALKERMWTRYPFRCPPGSALAPTYAAVRRSDRDEPPPSYILTPRADDAERR